MDSVFKNYLMENYPLSETQMNNLLEEVQEHYKENQTAFIQRRHLELQREGFKNRDIYTRISEEMENRLFAGNPLTERQIRRIIYG